MFKKLISKLTSLFKREAVDASYARMFVYALPADYGDSILVQFVGNDERNHYIWVDGGLGRSYEQHGKAILSAIAKQEEHVDLMVVSHVDQDHIGGILAMASDPEAPHDFIEQYWFNASRNLAQHFDTRHHPDREVPLPRVGLRSIDQGMKLESFLQKQGRWHTKPVMGFRYDHLHGLDVLVLGPTEAALEALAHRWEDEMNEDSQERSISFDKKKPHIKLEELAALPFKEDQSKANASSIVLALEYEGYRVLLPGDAHPSDLERSILALGYSKQRPMVLDAFKLSHHGSKKSLSPSLLDIIDCRHYIVSTDASRYGLPNREALARVVMHPRNHKRGTHIHFNYDNEILRGLFSEEELKTHNIELHFPTNPQLGAVLNF
ncbi:MAG: ComEC/Rec2 family competence protein [Bacteroidia bacterium]